MGGESGGMFTDIANIAAGIVNSGNLDMANSMNQAILRQILQDYANIKLPDLQSARPEQTGRNAYADATEDPALRRYQMEALDRLGKEVSTKGLTAEDLAAQQQALAAAGRFESGQRGAQQQRTAAQGMGGAMSAQLAALQGQQGAINQANTNAVDIAGQNRQRYMKAIEQMGQQAGSVRGQDWQKASQTANAQNQINQFNTSLRWQAQQHNLGLGQQNFNNQMKLTGAKSGTRRDMGNAWMQWALKQMGPTNQIAVEGLGAFGDDAAAAIAQAYGG